MIVSVFENEESADNELLMNSDLALEKTDKRSWDEETMYRVIKSRFSDQGTFIKAGELQSFVRQQEEKTREVKRDEGTEVDVEV